MNEQTNEPPDSSPPAEWWRSLPPMTLPGEIPKIPTEGNNWGTVVELMRAVIAEEDALQLNGGEHSNEREVIKAVEELGKACFRMLEKQSSKGNNSAAVSLLNLASVGVTRLNRELFRDRKSLLNLIHDFSKWPSYLSRSREINEVNLAPLLERNLGSNSIAKAEMTPWENAANSLVLKMFDYSNLAKSKARTAPDKIAHAEETGKLDPLLKAILETPDELNSDNWKEWHALGKMVLNHATNGKDREHPAFEKEPLKQLVMKREKWTDAITGAWKQLAKQGI